MGSPLQGRAAHQREAPRHTVIDQPDKTARLWWSLLAVVTLARCIGAARLPLYSAEAYYWLWSHHLAAGYYDHPPMIAWTIWLSTAIFGTNEFAVRVPSLAGGLLTDLGVWYVALRLAGPRAAARAGLVVLALPYFNVQSVIAFPDGPLLGFCALAVVCFVQDRYALGGIALGLAFLSKFPAAFLGAGLFVWRPRESWRWVPLALLTASPFFMWNAQHHWVTFGYQLVHRSQVESHFVPGDFVDYLVMQCLALSPILWFAMLIALWRVRRPNGLLFWPAAVPLLLFAGVSLTHKVEPHWPLVAYLTGTVALALVAENSRNMSRTLDAGLVLAFFMTGLLVLVPIFPSLLFTFKHSPEGTATTQIFAYPQLGGYLRDKAGDNLVFTGNNGISSALEFYSKMPIHYYSSNLHGREYLDWEDYSALRGRNAWYIEPGTPGEEQAQLLATLNDAFDHVGEPILLPIYWHGFVARTFAIYPCSGFKGHGPPL
jgi:undecaprenyl-diphosphatase